MNENIEVTSLVVHFNNAQDCIAVVESLLNLRMSKHKIVVVDNCSKEAEWKQVVQKFAANTNIELVVSEKNGGFGYGVNFGFYFMLKKYPTLKFLHVINCDALVIENNYLNELVNVLTKNKNAGLVGPAVLMEDLKTIQNTILPLTSLKNALNYQARFYGLSKITDPPEVQKVECVNGVCFVVKKEVFEQVGGFCEDYFMYNEEQDLCLKISKAGKDILYWSGKSILHKGAKRHETEKINWRYFYNRRNQVLFVAKHRSFLEAVVLAKLFIFSAFKKMVFNKESEVNYWRFIKALVLASFGKV